MADRSDAIQRGARDIDRVDLAATGLPRRPNVPRAFNYPVFGPTLPAVAGDYRLTTTAVRPARFELTTSVSAEWTFSSSHVDGQVALDLNVVRFLPKLAADGTAPAGKPFLVPLQVQDETGASTPPRHLTVEASYDEGKTWQRVPVTAKQEAKLRHPAGATSVSLRASATDRDGNTVKQTVIQAYKLR